MLSDLRNLEFCWKRTSLEEEQVSKVINDSGEMLTHFFSNNVGMNSIGLDLAGIDDRSL